MILDVLSVEGKLTALMRKYDRPGPRYTSYPTAPMFSHEFDADRYRKEIDRTNGSTETSDLSLYFHFPFCDTLCYFCGCTTVITRNRDRIREYLGYLKKEVDLLASRIAPQRRVVQMHWGGGTPTYLTPAEIADVTGHIKSRFNFSDDAEVSVEVDPRELTIDHLRALRQVGFNRISMGVQDFEQQVQRAVNRNQSEEITMQALAWSRELGFSSMNLDLIYGLPLQTLDSFTRTVDKAIGVSPDRIAVYNFAYVPWMKPHQKLIHQEDLPSPETKLKILMTTIQKFTDAGYVYIGMDHFAKSTDELTIAQQTKTLHRNFQGYSTKAGCDLFGLGMSSISHFGVNYAQNTKVLCDYYNAIDESRFTTVVGYNMTNDDQLRKFVIMRLMCDLVLNTRDVENRFGIPFGAYFRESLEKLQPLIDDDLLRVTSDGYEITTEGRLFLRNIAMCFDAYLGNGQKEKPIYSRTV
jgi:oxygen-independent coproporphyrinogen-3 oxidase